MANRIQLRRGTAEQWAAANPILAQGEPGIESDTGKQKFGNGTSRWNSLTYASKGDRGPAGPVSDSQIAEQVTAPNSETRTALNATFGPDVQAAAAPMRAAYVAAQTREVLAPLAAAGVRMRPAALAAVGTSAPTYTDIIGMLSDGVRKVFTNSGFNASQIGVSTDGVTFTWGKNIAGGNGIATSLVETPGGEVLVSVKHRDNLPGKVWRSTGWNPATANAASWAATLTASGAAVHFDGRWCLTQRSVAPGWSARAGAIFVAEYGNHINEAATPTEAAIRAYMSEDDGATWATIFDARDHNVDTNVHIHGLAYDPWDDRVLITVGDNANAGVYYCNGEDLSGVTAADWSVISGTGGSSAKQATTVIPMAASLILLSDSPNSAIRSIPRYGYRGYAASQDLLSIATGGTAVIGAHAYQSSILGPLLMSVYSSASSGPPAIYATLDGKNISTVYSESSSITSGPGLTSVVGPDKNGKIWFNRNMSGSGSLVQGTYTQTDPATSGASTVETINATSAARWGLLGHTYPVHEAGSTTTALASGTLYVMKVTAEADAALGGRTVRLWQNTASSGLTLAKAAVFDASGVKLGSDSADQSASLNGSGTSTRNIAVGSFPIIKGNVYYIAFLVVGGAGPILVRTSNSGAANAGLSGADLLWSTNGTGLTDMPATITPASASSQPIAMWFGLL